MPSSLAPAFLGLDFVLRTDRLRWLGSHRIQNLLEFSIRCQSANALKGCGKRIGDSIDPAWRHFFGSCSLVCPRSGLGIHAITRPRMFRFLSTAVTCSASKIV